MNSLRAAISTLVCMHLLLTTVKAGLISSSQVQQCINDGSAAALNCTKMIVVTLAVNSGQNQTEAISATLRETLDADGKLKSLTSPYRITLTKTPKYILYPLRYLQSFNNKPFEEARQVGPGWSGFFDPCEDRSNAPASTCDPVLDAAGQRVPDSQGFCCYCSVSQSLGFDPYTGTRSDLTCTLFGNQMASAHCLKMDPLWYFAYETAPPMTVFTITVTITKQASTNPAQPPETLVISPSQQSATNQARSVRAVLNGDLVSYTGTLQLDSKYLLIPATAGHPRTTEGVSNYLLVDKTMVSLDGTQCDKIGTAYSAFRNQNRACTTPAGTCLSRQPDDLYKADMQSRAAGVKGRYFASNFGNFDMVALAAAPNVHYFSYIDLQVSNSLLTLTLAADDMRFIVNRATGVIISCIISSFEAMSSNGLLEVVAANTGLVNADFSVSVTACSFGILAVPELIRTIDLAARQTFSFTVDTAVIIASTDSSCTVTLKDSLANVLETRVVKFNITAVREDRGAQGGRAPQLGSSTASQYSTDCATKCPSFVAFSCFWAYSCWSLLGRLVGIAAGILLLMCCCHGNIWRLLRFLCRQATKLLRSSHDALEVRNRNHQSDKHESDSDTESDSDSDTNDEVELTAVGDTGRLRAQH